MGSEYYQPGRPNTLRRGKGVLESFLDVCYKVATSLSASHPQPNQSVTVSPVLTQPALPGYILDITDDIIFVHKDKKREVIDPFLSANHIIANHLYISVTIPDCIGLKKDVFLSVLQQAEDIVTNCMGDHQQDQRATELLHYFLCVYETPFEAAISESFTETSCPYKVPAAWEIVHP